MTVTIDQKRIRKILVIKLRAVGDVLLSTIVIRNLRRAFPDAQIDFLTEPPSRAILSANPDLSHTKVYDRKKRSPLRYLLDVRAEQYDLVLDLFGNPRTAFLTAMSRAPYRVGFAFRGRRYAYNLLVTPRGDRVHNTQFNLDALEAIEVPVVDRNVPFYLTEEDERYVAPFFEHLESGRPVVALNTGGGWYTKRWGLEKFATLAEHLSVRFDVLLLWGPGQLPEAERLKGMVRPEVFIAPPTTLQQLGALLKHCLLVVSNDSGPMHIAAAVGTPVLGIFGPTNPLLQGPYGERNLVVRREGLSCLGCNLTSCPIGHLCMQELTVGEVLVAVERLIESNQLLPPRAHA